MPGEHEADEALALEVYRAVRPGASSDEPGSIEAELLQKAPPVGHALPEISVAVPLDVQRPGR